MTIFKFNLCFIINYIKINAFLKKRKNQTLIHDFEELEAIPPSP